MIYIQFPSKKGGVTHQNYKGWSEVYYINFGVTRPTSMLVGQKMNRAPSQPNFSHLTLTKPLDGCSNELFSYACDGGVMDKVEVHLCGDSSNQPHAKYVLTNVMVSEFSTTADGSGHPQELIELSYTSILKHYIGRDPKAIVQGPHISGFDLESAVMW